MKITTSSIFMLSCLLFSCTPKPIIGYQVIPEPQSISYSNGAYKLDKEVSIAFPQSLESEAKILSSYLATDFGINSTLEAGKNKGDITLIESDKFNSIKPNGYEMQVNSKGVLLTANNNTGIFNGLQTLRQAIMIENNNLTIQYAVVEDYPAFAWRSFMLDEGRHFKGVEVVKDLLDEMALLKMNTFQWHLTDDQGWRIEIKKYPKLTEVGSVRDSTEINHFGSEIYDGKPHSGYYTQEQIKEIVAYAAERHITIIPEIEMPGHASAAIAAYPWLGTTNKQIKVPCRFGVQYDVYDVTKPEVLAFFDDVLSEIIELFPTEVIHIGGDEVRYNHWNESPSVKAYMKKNGIKSPNELQVFFTNNISNLLASKGKRMIGWNEITGDKVNDYQEAESKSAKNDTIQTLAKGTVVQFWKGDPTLMLSTVEKGYEILNSFHEYTYLDYSYKSIPLSKAYAFNVIPEGLSKENESKVVGLGCQMWGEFTPTVQSMNQKIYPRIAAYAENGWTLATNKNYERFLKALPHFLNRWEKAGKEIGPISE